MADESSPRSLELLGKCAETELLEKFIHEVIDGIVWNTKSTSYQLYKDIWTIPQWYNIKLALENVVRKCVGTDQNKEDVIEELSSLSLADTVQKSILECLWPRRDEIKSSLVQETCQISHCHLRDFDCAVKLIVGSDKLASLREPVMGLDLDLQKETDSRRVSVELNSDQLEHLITTLEAANKVVQQLKG